MPEEAPGLGAGAMTTITTHALTASAAWARIEAGAHYPSDTLFSIALGNFIGATVNDAFITPAWLRSSPCRWPWFAVVAPGFRGNSRSEPSVSAGAAAGVVESFRARDAEQGE
jgi:hypothetical protein